MRRFAILLGGVLLAPTTGRAQLGELQAGVLGGYGQAHAFGPAAGLSIGVAPGRLAYAGARWTYYFGVPEQRGATSVRTKVQVISVDVGVEIPVGALEVYPGIGIGWSQFTQRATQPVSSGSSHEFFAAPGVAVEFHLGHMAVIPELQYSFAGAPNVPLRVKHQGVLLSLRWVWLHELKRIRR